MSVRPPSSTDEIDIPIDDAVTEKPAEVLQSRPPDSLPLPTYVPKRRTRNSFGLRVPDDEITRPETVPPVTPSSRSSALPPSTQPAPLGSPTPSLGIPHASPPAAVPAAEGAPKKAASIAPSRIVSVGAPMGLARPSSESVPVAKKVADAHPELHSVAVQKQLPEARDTEVNLDHLQSDQTVQTEALSGGIKTPPPMKQAEPTKIPDAPRKAEPSRPVDVTEPRRLSELPRAKDEVRPATPPLAQQASPPALSPPALSPPAPPVVAAVPPQVPLPPQVPSSLILSTQPTGFAPLPISTLLDLAKGEVDIPVDDDPYPSEPQLPSPLAPLSPVGATAAAPVTTPVAVATDPNFAGRASAPPPLPTAPESKRYPSQTPPKMPPIGMSSSPNVAAAAAADARDIETKSGPVVVVAAPQSPIAPPPMTAENAAKKKGRFWWEDFFNEDYLRATPKLPHRTIEKEVDFIEGSLGIEKGGTVLDLACGTGGHAIELGRRGYEVVGFDYSLPMLARAGEHAQNAGRKINFVQGDMREMNFEEHFDGIFSWNTSFGFFEEEKNQLVISKVHKALKTGGQFLLDVVNRDFIGKDAPSLVWFQGEGCVCMDEMQMDWITSRMRIKRTMMIEDGRSREIEYSIRVYSLHELGKMMHDAGFRVVEVSGSLATPGVFFGGDSRRTIILAEKR